MCLLRTSVKILTQSGYLHTVKFEKKKKKRFNTCPGHLGRVDFLAGQVTLHSHLPYEQGPGQAVCGLNKKKK